MKNRYSDIQSKYNEAEWQMLRGHNLQDLVNNCKINLEAWNDAFQCYNYQIVFRVLSNLLAETSSKLDEKTELKKAMNFKKAIEQFTKINPMHIKSNNGEKDRIDKASLEVINDYLYDYELMIRDFREIHGFSSPLKEDDEGL